MAKLIQEKTSFQLENERNEEAFKEILKTVRPDLFVLFDLLDETGINPIVVWRTIRQLYNIQLGGGYGTVVIEIQDKTVTFIRGQENDKIVEPLTVQKTGT